MPTIDYSLLPELHWVTPEVHLHLTADPVGLFPSWLAGIAIFLAVVTVPYQAITGAFGYLQEQFTDSGAVTEVTGNAEGAPPDIAASNQTELSPAALQEGSTVALEALFEGGANSVVARTVGHAEGTRTAVGEKTQAYYGHVDPGNGAWNLGSFSYQHGADSPEEADVKQLRRLREQAVEIRRQAVNRNIVLGLEAELNGIDLANQAPEAALDQGGYIDRLAEAYSRGLEGADAILWARTWSYLDPKTEQWNAPGLGNTLWSIRDDQERRRQAIAQALNFVPVEATLAMDTAPVGTALQEPGSGSDILT
ncbi:MAG: hypothetical protein AAF289_04365 [Cyanobacteria bacterium P01_A01_bin.135]